MNVSSHREYSTTTSTNPHRSAHSLSNSICPPIFFFFFLNDPPPPEIYPLPLHAALPISRERLGQRRRPLSRLGKEVAEAHDRGERVVQIVRHAGDQLTNRRHFLRLYELLLQPAPLRLVLEYQDCGPRLRHGDHGEQQDALAEPDLHRGRRGLGDGAGHRRSEEHTSELQSQSNLVCRLL